MEDYIASSQDESMPEKKRRTTRPTEKYVPKNYETDSSSKGPGYNPTNILMPPPRTPEEADRGNQKAKEEQIVEREETVAEIAEEVMKAIEVQEAREQTQNVAV